MAITNELELLGELAEDILEVLRKYNARVPIPSVVGVLQIVATGIINESLEN